MQESLKQKENITRYTAPDFYKKTRVLYEAPGNLLQVNWMDYKFEGQKYFKGICVSPKRENSTVGRNCMQREASCCLSFNKRLPIWEIRSKADKHRK